jgi:hypothetical protein
MDNVELRLAELHYELGMLRTALELMSDPADRGRILVRVSACVAEYTQLIDGRLSATISAYGPSTKRCMGKADPT